LRSIRKIHNDGTVEVLAVGPDRDSLGMVEFRYIPDPNKDDFASFTLPSEAITLLMQALQGLIRND